MADGTNQYIRGKEEVPAEDLLARSGLGVVTILIGIFSRSTGEVKGGVVNQPFVSLKVCSTYALLSEYKTSQCIKYLKQELYFFRRARRVVAERGRVRFTGVSAQALPSHPPLPPLRVTPMSQKPSSQGGRMKGSERL